MTLFAPDQCVTGVWRLLLILIRFFQEKPGWAIFVLLGLILVVVLFSSILQIFYSLGESLGKSILKLLGFAETPILGAIAIFSGLFFVLIIVIAVFVFVSWYLGVPLCAYVDELSLALV